MKTLLSPQQTGKKLQKTTSVSILEGKINTAVSYIDCKDHMMFVFFLTLLHAAINWK